MKKYFILSLVAVFLFSCNQFSGSNNNQEDKIDKSVKNSEKNEKNTQSVVNLKIKYPYKSGIIKYENDAMGIKSTVTVYFNNYGAQECAVSEMDVSGQKMTMRSLKKDNYLYQLSMDQKSGSKVKVDDKFTTYLFDNESFEQKMKEVHGKKLGNEEIMGKDCQVYSMQENGAVSKLWIWKNIILKMTAEQDAMSMEMLAVDVQETDDFPKGIFEVPEGFNIEEIKDYQNEDIDDFDDENAAG